MPVCARKPSSQKSEVCLQWPPGDANQVGQLLYYYQAVGAGAQNLSDTVTSANFSTDTQRNAFAEAIRLWLTGSGNQAGTAISAALLSNQAAAVSQAYAQVRTVARNLVQ